MEQKKSIWDECINLYSLQKTLRFELRPVGKTIEHIKNASLIEEDEQRAKDFQEAKKIIDKYHQQFIEKALREVSFSMEELTAFKNAYDGVKKDKTDNDARKKLAEHQKKLRNSLRKKLEGVAGFKHLFDKELIRKILPDWDGLDNDQKKFIKKFTKWTTYFKGFNENRKNVYSKEEISTSLIFRIIHDNLPKFLDNLDRFKKLREEHSVDFPNIKQELNDILEKMPLSRFFSLENFNNCINQSGIEKFNTVLGGKTLEDGEKIKGINEYVNEHSQNAPDKEKRKAIRKLKLLPLFKQILSDRESSSFAYEPIEDDAQAVSAVTKCYQQFKEEESKLRNLLGKLQDYDLKSIHVNSVGLKDISKQLYGEWNIIGEAMDAFAKKVLFPSENPEKPLQKDLKRIASWKKAKHQSISDIEEALRLQGKGEHEICKYFSSLKKKTESEEVSLFEAIKRTHDDASVVLSSTKYSKTKKDLCKQENEQDVAKIKALLDALIECYRFVKPLHVGSKDDKNIETADEIVDVEGDFYGTFDEIFEKLESVRSAYNKVRNHVTQKPFETKKFKLNFDNPALLGGWDKNKEKDYSCVLFLKSGKYFLGVMNKNHRKSFENIEESPENDYYAKMEYKQIADALKDIQNLMVINGETVCKKGRKNDEGVNQQLEALKNKHLPRNINEIRKQKSYLKSSERFDRTNCIAFIDYYKERLKYFPFDFNLKPSGQYGDLKDFVEDVGSQGYRIDFKNISSDYINSLVEEGKLYLFQIYSKDFSPYSKGRKNLNTLYWIELFTSENLKDAVYKLNGEAELFYRKKSIKQRITHPKNTPIGNKDPIEGKKTSTFGYDLIKDERYAEDKFLFHCPITLNFKAKRRLKVNDTVNDTIGKKVDDIRILSIDRGERHLAYYTLLDSKGKILDQGSFNSVTNFVKNTKRNVDYHKKLDELEGKRDDARKNWKKIENIKELKEGYLSQIVHTIVKIATENNAIIVLEDLNFGFKMGRFRIEKQVYQKLEKKLIDKLSYLVFKDREKGAAGGLRKAYQLASPFESFKKMGKQTGIIYYVPAHHTSKMCPRTGFINRLYPKYESKEKAKSFFGKFERIAYNREKGYFEFTFSYKKQGVEKLKKDVWTVCSQGTRLETFRNPEKNNNFDDRERNVTEELKTLFSNANIDYSGVENIREQIISIDSEDFFRKLTELLKLTLKMRNSRTGNDEDYFLSCVSDSNGEFFDSRKAKEHEPKNADANGAYNIGVKGLMVVNEIRENRKRPNLKISAEQFFNFAVSHNQGVVYN